MSHLGSDGVVAYCVRGMANNVGQLCLRGRFSVHGEYIFHVDRRVYSYDHLASLLRRSHKEFTMNIETPIPIDHKEAIILLSGELEAFESDKALFDALSLDVAPEIKTHVISLRKSIASLEREPRLIEALRAFVHKLPRHPDVQCKCKWCLTNELLVEIDAEARV
jgi:hypothetical protein